MVRRRLLDRVGMRSYTRPALAFTLALSASIALASPSPIALPGDRAFPESITSTKDGTLYTGSISQGGVVRIRADGAAAPWIKPGAFGSASTLGVLADERSNTLWVCSNNFSGYGITVPGAAAALGSALIGFDLRSGKGRVRALIPGERASCNDMAVGADGSVYVTNSDAPEILRLPPGDKQLEVWFHDASLAPAPDGTGLDGIAFGDDGNVYVNRYDAADIYRIDVKAGKALKLTRLNPSRPLVLADAIRHLGKNVFLLVEGGGRLDTMTVSGDSAKIVTLKDGYDTPTSVTAVGNTAWVSEGQLPFLFDPTKQSHKPKLPFQIFPVELHR